jgi:ATP/maltotriose-dependent transcriptional regulator MalT
MGLPSFEWNRRRSRSSGLIERPRLLSKLRDSAEHKLTLITAPPGYGKTTLVTQFERQSALPVAWHTVEERERDVPNLHQHCLLSLSQVASDIEVAAPKIGYGPGELAALVTDFMRDCLHRDIIYVLDDVHNLSGSPAAEIWLRALVAGFATGRNDRPPRGGRHWSAGTSLQPPRNPRSNG